MGGVWSCAWWMLSPFVYALILADMARYFIRRVVRLFTPPADRR